MTQQQEIVTNYSWVGYGKQTYPPMATMLAKARIQPATITRAVSDLSSYDTMGVWPEESKKHATHYSAVSQIARVFGFSIHAKLSPLLRL